MDRERIKRDFDRQCLATYAMQKLEARWKESQVPLYDDLAVFFLSGYTDGIITEPEYWIEALDTWVRTRRFVERSQLGESTSIH